MLKLNAMLKIVSRENENPISLVKRFNRASLIRKNLFRRQEYFIKPSKRKM